MQYRLLVAAGAAMCVGLTMSWVQPAAISALINGLGLNESTAGLIVSAEVIAIALMPLVLAPVMGRLSCRRLSLVGGALVIIANSAAALSQQVEILAALRVLAGVGAGAVYAAALAVLSGLNNPIRHYAQCFAATVLYGAVLLAVLPGVLGPQANQAFYGVLAVFTLPLWVVLWLLPAKPVTSAQTGVVLAGFLTMRASGYGAVVLLLGIATGSIWAFMFEIGLRTDLGVERVGIVMSVVVIAGLAGSLIAAWISAWIAERRTRMQFAIAVALAAFALPALLITHSTCSVLFAFGSTLCTAATFFLWPLLLGIAGTLDRNGTLGALVGATFILGNSVAPIAGGYAIESGGLETMGLACAVGTALAGAWMIGLLEREAGLSAS